MRNFVWVLWNFIQGGWAGLRLSRGYRRLAPPLAPHAAGLGAGFMTGVGAVRILSVRSCGAQRRG